MTELTNKKALVTGAAGGIGKAIVAALKSAGASVAVADRNTSTLSADACFPGDLLDAVYADTLPKNMLQNISRNQIV